MTPLQLQESLKAGADVSMRQLAGLRGKYEACFLFLLLMIVEWVIPGPASLAQITPHPFWLPVVLLSVQYGSGTGLGSVRGRGVNSRTALAGIGVAIGPCG